VHEYETRESPEAKAVKDLDMLEMIVQVLYCSSRALFAPFVVFVLHMIT
jgi:5'-deoxynucleotidase YfbR-like HD superfamily hydrolase